MTLEKIIGTGGTLKDELLDKASIIQGFINALDLLEGNYHNFEEIKEETILSVMVKEAIKQSKGTLNPIYITTEAKSFLDKYNKK
ncbi:hypothetical protein [Aliarcobacter butzleri]|uniref:hypothetical protein n=1 Tax=Aliarcobacter butzleri TaxID=28197 RepID=UPI002B24C5EE|nr:hypothetical protein [Aliarcobacter butzleri]